MKSLVRGETIGMTVSSLTWMAIVTTAFVACTEDETTDDAREKNDTTDAARENDTTDDAGAAGGDRIPETSFDPILGAWSAFELSDGEFSSFEHRIFFYVVEGRLMGQQQTYANDIDGFFKGQEKLYNLHYDEGHLSFTFAGEEENDVSLTLEGGRLLGSGAMFERVGDVNLCESSCLGEYCDMIAGQCADCGNQDCEEACKVPDDCPESYQTCHVPTGTCYSDCEDCGRGGRECVDGVCVYPNQLDARSL